MIAARWYDACCMHSLLIFIDIAFRWLPFTLMMPAELIIADDDDADIIEIRRWHYAISILFDIYFIVPTLFIDDASLFIYWDYSLLTDIIIAIIEILYWHWDYADISMIHWHFIAYIISLMRHFQLMPHLLKPFTPFESAVFLLLKIDDIIYYYITILLIIAIITPLYSHWPDYCQIFISLRWPDYLHYYSCIIYWWHYLRQLRWYHTD